MTDGIKSIQELDDFVKLMRKTVTTVRYRASNLEEIQASMNSQKDIAVNIDISMFENDEYEEVIAYDILEFEDNNAHNYDDESNGCDEIPSSNRSNAFTTIKSDSPTRWHSLLIMLESLKKNKCSIIQLLAEIDSDILIRNKDWNLLDELIDLLSNFKQSVEILSQDKHCSINSALLLRTHLKNLISTESDKESPVIKKMKKQMREKFDKRFPLTDIVVLGALLDPRFKNLDAIDEYVTKIRCKNDENSFHTKETFLVEKLLDMNLNVEQGTDDDRNSDDESPAAEKKSNTKNQFLLNLIEKYSLKNEKTDIEKKVDMECSNYLNLPPRQSNMDILEYWKKNQFTFPNLSKLASRVLCVPATSTPSERVFSIAGTVINKKRSTINPNNVNKIIFIHDNYDLAKAHVK